MCTDNQASLSCCSALFLYLSGFVQPRRCDCAKAALISAVLCNDMYLFLCVMMSAALKCMHLGFEPDPSNFQRCGCCPT